MNRFFEIKTPSGLSIIEIWINKMKYIKQYKIGVYIHGDWYFNKFYTIKDGFLWIRENFYTTKKKGNNNGQ